jgi:hypothetical protein
MCAKINMVIFSDELSVYLLLRTQNYFKHKTRMFWRVAKSQCYSERKNVYSPIFVIYISSKIMAAVELLQCGSRSTIRKMKQKDMNLDE